MIILGKERYYDILRTSMRADGDFEVNAHQGFIQFIMLILYYKTAKKYYDKLINSLCIVSATIITATMLILLMSV